MRYRRHETAKRETEENGKNLQRRAGQAVKKVKTAFLPVILSLFMLCILGISPFAAGNGVQAADEGGSAYAGTWHLQYALSYTASTKMYRLTQVKVDTGSPSQTIGGVILRYPSSLQLKGADDSWKPQKIKQGEAAKGASAEETIQGYVPAEGTAERIASQLERLRFYSAGGPITKGSIGVQIDTVYRPLLSFTDAKGTVHYYEVVKKRCPWSEAYNAAKKKKLLGMRGYLATITSQAEQNFIYNNINKEGGWLGGTRYLIRTADGRTARIKDDASVDAAALIKDTASADAWYWADGPEAGQVFYDRPTVASPYGEGGPEKMFCWFSDGEPNNFGSGEGCLQFAYMNDRWNDLADHADTSCANYYVEYSRYGNDADTGEMKDYASHTAALDAAAVLPAEVHTKVSLSAGSRSADAMLHVLQEQDPALDISSLTVDRVTLDRLNSAILKGKPGVYPVKIFLHTQGSDQKTPAYILHVRLRLNGYRVEQAPTTTIANTAKPLSKNELLRQAGVIVYDEDGNPADISVLSADEKGLARLNRAIERQTPGRYQVAVYDPNGGRHMISVTVAPKDETPVQAVSSAGGTASAAATGDDRLLAVPWIMLAAALAALSAWMVRRRRH